MTPADRLLRAVTAAIERERTAIDARSQEPYQYRIVVWPVRGEYEAALETNSGRVKV